MKWAYLIIGAVGLCLCAGCNEKLGCERAVYHWLVAQQQSTGLLGNEEGDSFAGLYSNALAAMCYTHQGDLAAAERIFAFFESQRATEFATNGSGGFHQFWDARTGRPHLDTDRWVGDNAWLLLALNYHRRVTGQERYPQLRAALTDWIISLQQSDGGIASSFNKQGRMDSQSTEGNLDCYAALVDRPAERARVRSWLETQMWVADQKRFRMGSTVDETALDCVAWAVAALGPDYAKCLPYAESKFAVRDRSDATGRELAGFTDFLGRRRIWLEGTGEMVVAYQTAGRDDQAAHYISELRRAMRPSATVLRAAGLACHTSEPSWKTGSTRIFVPAQAWYLFGSWGFNPMRAEE